MGRKDGINGRVILHVHRKRKGTTHYGLMMATVSPVPVGVRSRCRFTSAVVRAKEKPEILQVPCRAASLYRARVEQVRCN